ncbi:MAG: WecB/TagA/CpsF family glycosyltransferase [Thermodesulfobacteriota bacterium]|nr:WecB/TagA/CpsF family glycosyltransferase [Thermodesulfobacteriota bacterium]
MIAAINRARPDILWVGMTAPKQEKWLCLNRDKLKVPFAGAIGAVFDFYAGTKQRSCSNCAVAGFFAFTFSLHIKRCRRRCR